MKIYSLIVSACVAVGAHAGPVDVNKAKALAQKYLTAPVSVETVSAAAMGKGNKHRWQNPLCTCLITKAVKVL